MGLVSLRDVVLTFSACLTDDVETVIEEVDVLLSDDEPGEKVILTLLEMTGRECEDIPVFQGF